MFTKYINPNIQQTLRAKEIALSRTVDTRATPNTPRFPDNISANAYNDITDIATRSVFFRKKRRWDYEVRTYYGWERCLL